MRPAALPSSCEVAVVGGGVIGAACSHALTEAGVPNVLLEAGQVGAGASGACEGNVLVSDKTPGPEFEMARRSLALYEDLEERLGADIQLEAKGSILVAPTEAALDLLGGDARWLGEEGVTTQLLDAEAALRAEPALDPGIAGALFVADDLQLCPMRLVRALVAASVGGGARVVPSCPARAIEVRAGRVVAVVTDQGRLACSTVVVTAGLATGRLLATAGVRLPVSGRRGQILVGARAPGLIRHKVYDAGYRTTVEARDEPGVQVATVLETTRAGNVLIGASRELGSAASGADVDVDARLARNALALAPGLAGLRILRSYAGVRPTLPDGLPAVGPVPAVAGLLVASGHEGAGIGLAPATAELIAAHVTGGGSALSPEPFLPGRLTAGSLDDAAERRS